MTLRLYMHPLSSYSHKVLIALYENGTPFETKRVDDPAVLAELKASWPVARFPVLVDDARDKLIPESSIIIEYLARHYPGMATLVPDDPDLAREVRMRDRFFDNYLHAHMQKFFSDRNRPADKRDAHGVGEAKSMFFTALGMVDRDVQGKTWVMGETFSMADCAAGPPLFYGNMAWPFEDTHANAFAYLQRLMKRPSYARALEEAKPFFDLLPAGG